MGQEWQVEFSFNSMNIWAEAAGIALPDNCTIPAIDARRIRLVKHTGMRIMELLKKDFLNNCSI